MILVLVVRGMLVVASTLLLESGAYVWLELFRVVFFQPF